MSDVVHAFMESPQYRRGILFIDYDEWGGFFDHVKPRHVPDQRESSNLATDYGFTGFRIPGVCVSPFSRFGGVSHLQVTHESILKLISYRWQLGHLNRRHRHATNIGRTLDFARPRREPPSLPDPTAIAGTPCPPSAAPGAKLARPKPHDMAKLESSGLLERYGYRTLTPSFDQVFRRPDSVRQALRNSVGAS
jgi:phospholipase C